jgi:GNAT superfamily N-acetyltransferase
VTHRLIEDPAPPRAVAWTVTDGERPLGCLHGRRPQPDLWVVDRVGLGPTADQAEVLGVLAMALVSAVDETSAEVLIVEREELVPCRRALEAAGLRVHRRKVAVGRDLTTWPALSLAPRVNVATLHDVGEAAFIARMALASTGDPFEDREGGSRDYDGEWRALVASAGPRFDARTWLLVDDARGPVGVLLPQPVTPTIGTLFYVGVVPARRGEGLGRMLHALGLTRLAAQGLVRYVGSTDTRNAAMLRVFAANGCPIESTEVYLGG